MRVALMFPLLVLSKSIVCLLSLVKLSPPLLVISSPSHKVASKEGFFQLPLSRILLKRRCSRLILFWQHHPFLSFACPSLDVRNTLDPICVSDVLFRSLCSFRDCFSCAVSWVWCGTRWPRTRFRLSAAGVAISAFCLHIWNLGGHTDGFLVP